MQGEQHQRFRLALAIREGVVSVSLEVLIRTALADPADALSCYAAADLLEERGDDALAFAWRWMGWNGVRPAWRESARIQRPWAWYCEDKQQYMSPLERERTAAMPYAVLPQDLFQIIYGPMRHVAPCVEPESLIDDLASGLRRMRRIVEKPKGSS